MLADLFMHYIIFAVGLQERSLVRDLQGVYSDGHTWDNHQGNMLSTTRSPVLQIETIHDAPWPVTFLACTQRIMRLDRYVSTVYYFLTALAHCCFSYTRMHAKSTKKRKKKLRPVIGTYKPKLFPTQITTIIIRFIYHEFDSAILSCILAIVHRKLFFFAKVVCVMSSSEICYNLGWREQYTLFSKCTQLYVEDSVKNNWGYSSAVNNIMGYLINYSK